MMQIWSGQIKVLQLHGTPAGHKNKRDRSSHNSSTYAAQFKAYYSIFATLPMTHIQEK